MTYQELYELVPSDTLQRDIEIYERTGSLPGGYTLDEMIVIESFIFGGRRDEE
jgi:hypothetical protein